LNGKIMSTGSGSYGLLLNGFLDDISEFK
jgi:hypothetical protein